MDDRRTKFSPQALAYLIGPFALVLILVLRHFGVLARESDWTWVGVFALIPALSLVVESLYRRTPSRAFLHARVLVHVGAVTTVIYLTGWGSVLVAAFAFVALENIAHDGSRTWRVTALWSVVGIAVGQLFVALGWIPSFISTSRSQMLGLLGTFVVLFVIRMAGATAEQKETAEASMRTSEDRFRSLVQHSSDMTWVVTPEGTISYASPSTEVLLGRRPEDVVGRISTDFMWSDDRVPAEAALLRRLESSDPGEPTQFRMEHGDGSWRFVEVVLTDLRDRPSVAGFVANIRDVTDRKEAESLLAHQALHDPLTGLPNRTLILDRAEQMLARSRRDSRPFAVLFIDLDNFKSINDTMGHQAGDQLLQAVGRRFDATLRSSDTVGRLGGDEFVILADGLSLDGGPDILAQRLHRAVREPFVLEGYENRPLDVTISVGIVADHRSSAHDLLRDADTALYRAKAMGKDCTVTFHGEMHAEVAERLSLEMDLRSAINDEQFFLLYQPVFALDDVNARGVEALLRWRHPTRGVIAPDDFIPMLEDTGLIVEVGRRVLSHACAQGARWHERGYVPSMSVNVSMRQLESAVLVDHVREALTASGLDPGYLIVEVTETALMRDPAAAIARLGELKALGVSIAIDDFGTGYSSLAYLRQFPVDSLKIDRSFIAAMSESNASLALVHAFVELGRALGLETLAEGIEDRHQLETLQREQCESGQGFLFSHPVEPDVAESFFRRTTSSLGHPGTALSAHILDGAVKAG